MTYLAFAAGLFALFLGGEFLIRGAVGMARRFRVPQLVIGLTIVGFGTSTPELLVSIQAALAGSPALAIGNVIGSNIANTLLILGLSAMIVAVPMKLADLRREFAVMLLATVLLWLMLLGGVVSRLEGLTLFAGLGVYLWTSFRGLRGKPGRDRPKEPAAAVAAEEPDVDPTHAGAEVAAPLWQSLPSVLAGLVILMVGARLLVESASDIARAFGISEAVIGLTIVAVGTSLPELATSILAALRRHPEIAVGNILGSNIFNILSILGLTALVEPIPVDARFAGFDIAFALAAGIAMLGFAALPGRVGRLGGAALLAAYGGYIAVVGLA